MSGFAWTLRWILVTKLSQKPTSYEVGFCWVPLAQFLLWLDFAWHKKVSSFQVSIQSIRMAEEESLSDYLTPRDAENVGTRRMASISWNSVPSARRRLWLENGILQEADDGTPASTITNELHSQASVSTLTQTVGWEAPSIEGDDDKQQEIYLQLMLIAM